MRSCFFLLHQWRQPQFEIFFYDQQEIKYFSNAVYIKLLKLYICVSKVRLTYRMAWVKGSGPCGSNCSPANIGRLGTVANPELSTLKWVSRMGNITNKIKDVNYVVTSVSKRNVTSWEQGEDIIFIRTPSIQPFAVS